MFDPHGERTVPTTTTDSGAEITQNSRGADRNLHCLSVASLPAVIVVPPQSCRFLDFCSTFYQEKVECHVGKANLISRSSLLLLGMLYLLNLPTQAQSEISILLTNRPTPAETAVPLPKNSSSTPFTLKRNLIFFRAVRDGQPGLYILDTGAPSLVINHRGEEDAVPSRFTGQGAGGRVELSDHRVERFEVGGQSVSNYWAVGTDLSAMEERIRRRIDGFVGYDLINRGELRIDYAAGRFNLLPSQRQPLHEGRAPRATLRFTLVDHLPVVQLRIDGRRYAFAIDTGAGINLIERKLVEDGLALPTGERMNVQGMNGRAADQAIVALPTPAALPETGQSLRLVSYDLGSLQSSGGTQLSGILGSAFLSQYTVGIDYRRQRIYLW
jgi:hypothetical protein